MKKGWKSKNALHVAHAMKAIERETHRESLPLYRCTTCGTEAWTFEAARKHEYRFNVLHGQPIMGTSWQHLPEKRCIVCGGPTYGTVCHDCLGRRVIDLVRRRGA